MATTGATVFGILADEVDATAATSGVVYLTGSFLRDPIIAANSGATIDLAFEDALRTKGIYFERSSDVKLNIDLLTKGHLWAAGARCLTLSIPLWVIRKHRCGDVEAAQICAQARRAAS